MYSSKISPTERHALLKSIPSSKTLHPVRNSSSETQHIMDMPTPPIHDLPYDISSSSLGHQLAFVFDHIVDCRFAVTQAKVCPLATKSIILSFSSIVKTIIFLFCDAMLAELSLRKIVPLYSKGSIYFKGMSIS